MADKDDTEETTVDADVEIKQAQDPVRKWTLVILSLCVLLMAWYLIADRVTPYTTQARVHALVIPIAPEVSGTVTEIAVSSNQVVAAGDLLFKLDRERYALVVETAEANLQSARQATGASTANVDTARAQVESAKANLVRAEQDATRLRRIKEEDPGAISERRLESAVSTLAISRAQLNAAESTVEKALQDLGQTGDANSRILQAQVALEQANIDLSNTEVRAPADGIVTDVRIDRGNFAKAPCPARSSRDRFERRASASRSNPPPLAVCRRSTMTGTGYVMRNASQWSSISSCRMRVIASGSASAHRPR
jgi:multidrug resistance efflux pump